MPKLPIGIMAEKIIMYKAISCMNKNITINIWMFIYKDNIKILNNALLLVKHYLKSLIN